jgi:hypothetical protein
LRPARRTPLEWKSTAPPASTKIRQGPGIAPLDLELKLPEAGIQMVLSPEAQRG